ncbi:PEP-CTERM sorting domain-containing protein [Crocosphaera chwakensis]|uniref:PEP-CTERM protein-sorting domain-containing protein n=1 Tax=Crocosphaera chwakensis CCY0110 TaxID=391612 RepID=A3IU88_9CHRO|nr:PEP-CTERM sorting domain-containing protein [Crocosphaera chwakensis]EAZ89962.1 hypothetical protein CY0110_07194 [Crocosphaera chwakensis CCY0110]
MKKLIQSLSIGTTGLTIAITIGIRPANALTFEFSQSGWLPGGGEVTGTFSGEDKNGDNKIIFDFSDPNINEVSAYEMSFQGNSTFTDFTHNLNDLFILEYMKGNPDMLTISSTDFTSSYDSENMDIDLGVISQSGESILTNESVNVSVREVPEPTSWIGLMLFGLGAYFKRKITTSFSH